MPNTTNKVLNVPNTGDLVGTWGSAAINPDMVAIDGMFGGVATVSLSSSNVLLSAPVGSVTPAAGPTQQQNAVIKLTGTLTIALNVGLTLPGYYIFHNLCTVGSFFVLLSNSTFAGTRIGLPPGKAQHVYFDGTTPFYVNTPDVGTYTMVAASTVPAWISNSTVPPYLLCNGTIYNISDFPFLGSMLGSTYGGNGSTTFGVPDLRGRYPLSLDGGTGRVTSGGSGINAAILGAAGGNQMMQQHTHTPGVIDSGHSHSYTAFFSSIGSSQYAGPASTSGSDIVSTTSVSTTGISVTIGNTGSGSSQNMPPTITSGIWLIKT